jgi:hypothetical protein
MTVCRVRKYRDVPLLFLDLEPHDLKDYPVRSPKTASRKAVSAKYFTPATFGMPSRKPKATRWPSCLHTVAERQAL